MPTLRKPRALRPGGTIGVAAPAFAVDAERLEAGAAQLRAAGFEVRHREDVLACEGYLAGSDARRAAELTELANDRSVGAILCARGGFGCHRTIPALEPGVFRRAGKPLAGYSDVTALHLWQLRRAGLVGLHTPMFDAEAGLSDEELEGLTAALTGKDGGSVREGRVARGGRAEGPLVGGSLAVLAASVGTPWAPELRGAILLFEEIGEKPYAIDRALAQLRCSGALEGVAGVGVGHLVGCTDPKRDEPSAEQVIEEALAPLGVPLVFGLPFGHAKPNLPWPVGARGLLDGERGRLHLLEAGAQ